MSDRGVSDYDMPNPAWPHPPAVSGIPDTALSALLDGGTSEADAPPSLQHVADLLAALRAEPGAAEAAGQAAAVAEFRRRVGVSPRASGSRRVRPALIPLLRSRTGTAVTAAVVGLSGIVAAAYTGALPAAAQQVAHDTIGAPRPVHHSATTSQRDTPVGPNATGHPTFGLCNAYLHGKQHGSAAGRSVALRNLEKAAGGAANVPSYCAGVPHPGNSHSESRHQGSGPKTDEGPHPTGKPPHP